MPGEGIQFPDPDKIRVGGIPTIGGGVSRGPVSQGFPKPIAAGTSVEPYDTPSYETDRGSKRKTSYGSMLINPASFSGSNKQDFQLAGKAVLFQVVNCPLGAIIVAGSPDSWFISFDDNPNEIYFDGSGGFDITGTAIVGAAKLYLADFPFVKISIRSNLRSMWLGVTVFENPIPIGFTI